MQFDNSQIIEIITKLGELQKTMRVSPTVRLIFKYGEIARIAASFRVAFIPEPGYLTKIKKILDLDLKLGETPFGFPMWHGEKGIFEFKLYCKTCGPGYEMVTKPGERGKVIRVCQPIQKK